MLEQNVSGISSWLSECQEDSCELAASKQSTSVLQSSVLTVTQMIAIHANTLPSPEPSHFHNVLENIKTIAETIGLVIGGLWAYYKFFRGRTFQSRLELTVSGNPSQFQKMTGLAASVQLKNVGLSKVPIEQAGTALRVLTYSSESTQDLPSMVKWVHRITVEVFTNHRWIEPGETIADQVFIVLAPVGDGAVRLELRIVSEGIEWNSISIVQIRP